jgi:glucose/arabinose dehydrogenase
VGFDWHPVTKQLYFTDNGRDGMGGPLLSENQPDCELNRLDTLGQDFGFPYCQSGGFGPPEMREAGRAEALEDPDMNWGGGAVNCSSKRGGREEV